MTVQKIREDEIYKRERSTHDHLMGASVCPEEKVQNIPIVKEIKLKRERAIKRLKRKFKLSMVVKVLVVFAIGMLVMFRYAQITQMGYSIAALNIQYERLQNENNDLRNSITLNTNLNEIRQRAERDHNLQQPCPSQIVYIDITAIDRTVILEDNTQEEERGLARRIGDWINVVLFGVDPE